ncbi:PEP-CTERM sorting domain-containing protein [Haloferula sargassicola]|uniref:PEP-CTERM protein-sorting domain-containing protein n=1 Tax=Haloferula sargassicola TaxID=490096 RepID=A0ABP9UP86_9BACT
MKATSFLPLVLLGSASAANLMLDFGSSSAVASPYLNLSPAHDAGAIPATSTSWNTISSSADRSDLSYADGNAALGVTLNLGQESTAGSGTVSFATEITNLSLAGSGGAVPGQQNLLTAGSIYGDDSSSTAAGRDGIFGSGSSSAGSAAGLRIDGLAAGVYELYVMARNTNTNAAEVPMIAYAGAGALSGTFDYSGLAGMTQSNPGYPSATYAGEYGSFVNGENFVKLGVTVADGDSIYVVIDGAGSDSRGFVNMVQVVGVPEPSALLLTLLGGGFFLRRRR